jgi:membrane-associated phospholipid phosphatase
VVQIQLPKQFPTRLAILGLYVAYFILTYKGIQIFTASYVLNINPALPYEALIPFVPATFYIYSLAYLFPAVLIFLTDIPTLKKIMLGFVFVSLIHYIVFLTFPISYTLRPSINPNQDFTSWLIYQFYLIDTPLNSLPSIHVSFVYLTYYFMKKYATPRLAHMGHFLAYLIAISTILVKQHYILDVFAGLLVSSLYNRYVIARPHQTQKPHSSNE